MSADYQLVELPNGAKTLYSASYGEKLHPGLGPAAEADLLYVRQLEICQRLQRQTGEFVIWDIGLGAAANALTLLRATGELPGALRLVSFDNTAEPLAFALANAAALGYLAGYETQVATLLADKAVTFDNGHLQVTWEFCLGDFPAWLERRSPTRRAEDLASVSAEPESPAPHAIFLTFPPPKIRPCGRFPS